MCAYVCVHVCIVCICMCANTHSKFSELIGISKCPLWIVILRNSGMQTKPKIPNFLLRAHPAKADSTKILNSSLRHPWKPRIQFQPMIPRKSTENLLRNYRFWMKRERPWGKAFSIHFFCPT